MPCFHLTLCTSQSPSFTIINTKSKPKCQLMMKILLHIVIKYNAWTPLRIAFVHAKVGASMLILNVGICTHDFFLRYNVFIVLNNCVLYTCNIHYDYHNPSKKLGN
jgi:hypothetical protein